MANKKSSLEDPYIEGLAQQVNDMADRRKKWFWGLSREGWITIITALLTFAFGYGMLSERVSGNEKNLSIFKHDTVKAIDDLKLDLKSDINQIRLDQREDFNRMMLLIKKQ